MSSTVLSLGSGTEFHGWEEDVNELSFSLRSS
jgi:hypothetical protein